MEQRTHRSSFKRSPFGIIGECFSIYGRHFRKLRLIALIIQAPMIALGFALGDSLPAEKDLQRLQVTLLGDPRESLPETAEYSAQTEAQELPEPLTRDEIVGLAISATVYFVATMILQTFASGIIAVAVGMHYSTGSIDVGGSFSRAWWRVLTLVVLGLFSFGLLLLFAAGLVLLILPGIIILALIIYWSIAVQAVAIEGCKPISALKRSFELVHRNWWRTFAATALLLLVIFGLTISLTLLFAAPMLLLGGEELSETATLIADTIFGTLTNAVIIPLAAIVSILIYLDLRSRKEDYDIAALSQDMGFAPRDEMQQELQDE